MVRIAGGTGVIVVTDIHCVGAPAEVRLRMLVRPMGAVRRDLRQETRRQLKLLATRVVDGEGNLHETPYGPVGCGAWQGLGMSLAYATAWAELEAELKCLGLPLQEGWISPNDPSVWRLTP